MNWKYWILILVFLFGLLYLGFTKYTDLVKENGKQQCEVAVYTDALDYKEWSAAITDETVREFMEDKDAINATRDETRKEAIDEYFKDKELPANQSTASDSDNDSGDDVRVAQLAKRMLDYYCTSRPKDVRCNPVGPIN